MIVTKALDVFTYDELSDDAKKIAMDHMIQFLWEALDCEMVTEDLNGELVRLCSGEEVGAISTKTLRDNYGVEINWSLSYSQSDHVGIRGRFDKNVFPTLFSDLPVTEFTTTTTRSGWSEVVSAGWDGDEGFVDYTNKELPLVWAELDDLERALMKCARESIESYTSEESALEYLRQGFNDRRFLESGKTAPTMFWTDSF